MAKLDKDYQLLLEDILNNGHLKENRTGVDTLSVFGRTIRHHMKDGFPLLTLKKMAWKTIRTELMWFLRGDTDIRFLLKHNCHIWDGDVYRVYSNYVNQEWESGYINELFEDGLITEASNDETNINYKKLTKDEFINKIKTDDEFAKQWGSLGPIYGKQWRAWGGEMIPGIFDYIETPEKFADEDEADFGIDQIQKLIDTLRTNPDSRRMLVSAWNVSDLDKMTLPPCHYGFTVYTRKLSLEERANIYFKRNPGWTLQFKDSFFDGHSIPSREISLIWKQRSTDAPLGFPFNIASYGLLLLMLADEVGMVPGEVIGHLEDTHIYVNQIDAIKQLIKLDADKYELPTVKINDGIYTSLLSDSEVVLENYQSHPKIFIPLSN